MCTLSSRRQHVTCLAVILAIISTTFCEYVREFQVSEGIPIGTTIGFIGDSNPGAPRPPQPPYLIIPVPESAVDSDLQIDQASGEIKSKVVLDREIRSYYSLAAIPLGGENIRVVITVNDENDNAPTFPHKHMSIEFPENTPRDVKRTLYPARDYDLGIFNTQRYNIVSGNKNNAFRLSSHRERDEVLYLDLQINGFLDRETTSFYSLVIEAYDGGDPVLKGSMTVNITIQDVNDNQPIFNQSRYFTTVAENATIGTSVLRVFATDTDSGKNGDVNYSINRRQSDRDNFFVIDPKTGVISVNKPLDFESKGVHELVVVAKDNGVQPLETTAFVSIRVTDVNDNQPTINLIFLSDDATPKISEDAQPGEFVARISVNDPDSKEEYSNVNVSLQGGDGHFGLTTRDNIIYLVIVSLPLDRELKPNYTMTVVARDQGTPPLHATRAFDLEVTDMNDNAPEFDKTVYYANVLEVADPGTSVLQLSAVDRDAGNNSAIVYSIAHAPDTHSHWFRIDPNTGLITTNKHIDCETDPVPRITVVATDNGSPTLSSSTTVVITIRDVNDNEPIFDQSFYNVSIPESVATGSCILKISATDPDCGVNAMVNYTIGGRSVHTRDFDVQAVTGDLCIAAPLDHERRNSYQIPVLATDRGGLSTTALVKIQIIDINDNHPVFYPREYNVSLRENVLTASPVVVVVATDADSGLFGQVTYHIVEGNRNGLFKIGQSSGEVFLTRALDKRIRMHNLRISAKDGAGLTSDVNAIVSVSVIDSTQKLPNFERARYDFAVREDVPSSTVVGSVRASSAGHGVVRYSIHSGDPNGYFSIDPISATITTNSKLDHETHPFILLNVQAQSGQPPSYGHSQVNITVWDVNDNSPQFDSKSIRISVPENSELNVPIYAAQAHDPDSGPNGKVHYDLGAAGHKFFHIDKVGGHLTLKRPLDYEKQQKYSLTIRARDQGSPPLGNNITLNIEVQDINDNAPVFEKSRYEVNVMESLPANSQFVQVTANDKDTGNNARLTYKLIDKDENPEKTTKFGIFPNSGSIYLKETLDRESNDKYSLAVVATDNGSPMQSSTCSVTVKVLDANDNDPKFSQRLYEFTVEENLGRGSHVGTMTAADQDLGNNASLRYNILPSNTSFQINPITGEIFTKRSLDREKKAVHEFRAEVRDQGSPPRQDRVTVRVLVTDTNDNSPEIVQPLESVISVREEEQAGVEVVQIKATDKDEGNNATITYGFFKGVDSVDSIDKFDINPRTGMVTTRVILDHEAKSQYTLTVSAQDGGPKPRRTTKILTIEVIDLTDNRPTFPRSNIELRLVEGVEIGTTVGTVRLQTDSGPLVYSIVSGNVGGVFGIDRITGRLFTAREVDRESNENYMLQVSAADPSVTIGQANSMTNVRITIDDINDNAPRFATDPVVLDISENSPVGTNVWTANATDIDIKDNSKIIYSLQSQSPREVFSIDPMSGVMTLVSALDHESLHEYILVLIATDQAKEPETRLKSSVTVKVVVTDENDNVPKFTSPSSIAVMENEPVGYYIMHILCTDSDSGDNGKIMFAISSGNRQGKFSLDHNTGLLSLVKSLDREETQKYVLNITASDHGSKPLVTSQLLTINVEDVNDNPPKFKRKLYRVNVSEDISPGSFVVRVGATDRDAGTNLTYIIPTGIADDKFSIDPRSGIIKTISKLNHASTKFKGHYKVIVFAHDGSFPAQNDSTTVLVTLKDVNDHVPDFHGSCYALHIPENSDLSVIHSVVAMDEDSGLNGEITYSITAGNIDNRFSIDVRTGELSSLPLDRERMSSYKLGITARDKGSPYRHNTCNITVNVIDQNDNDPEFFRSRYSTTIPEDIPIGSTVLVVKARDADAGDNSRITYSLSNETQWLFSIDNKTGIITTAGKFDREKRSSYSFEVRATDGGHYNARSARATVHINIGDINDNKPVFSRYPFTANIAHTTGPGENILRVVATDADQGINSQIVYGFVNSPPGNKFFINPETGVISASSGLASDSGRVLHLEVMAKDRGEPPQSSIGLVRLSVGPSSGSEKRLTFSNSSYDVKLDENASNGHQLIKVHAFVPDDRSSMISYKIGGGNEKDVFKINSNTGLIQVDKNVNLDYETDDSINLVIVAKTSGLNTLYGYASVKVNIQDTNDNAPRFTQDSYSASVWEGNNKGTFVMQVSATDDDKGQNGKIIYHIIDGNHDNAFLIEPPFSGIVKTNIVLDREIRDSYMLTIIATDNGSPQMTGTCSLSINIVDVNDNLPTFPPHSIISVSEGADVGTVVTMITANDVDTNPALTYRFAKNGNQDNMFSIDAFSGKLMLARPLDHETKQSYELKIESTDAAHVAQTKVTVNVLDINDNAPVFSLPTYQVVLMERTESGRSIVTVKATDKDKGENARIVYSLVKSPYNGFKINPKSGVVYTNKTIVFNPNTPILQLVVKASDLGKPRRSSMVAVYLQITYMNDRIPKFTKLNYTTHVSEDSARGTSILKVSTTEVDPREYKHNLYYSFVKGNENSIFHIKSQTGEITLVKDLDREEKKVYSLEVAAMDKNSLRRSSSAVVTVIVDDVNDHAPMFNQSSYETSVSELAPVGHTVLKLTASDSDHRKGAKIKYDITSGNDEGYFYLDPNSGYVTMQKSLDYDQVQEHHFIARATETQSKTSKSVITHVHIKVKDENDNPPSFPVLMFLEFAVENSPIGTSVFMVHANDGDRGIYGDLNYTISEGDGKDIFAIDKKSGLVSTNAMLDYETKTRYYFTVMATDIGGKFATVQVQVDIQSADEYTPEFTEESYQFTVPGDADVGYIVSRVQATDKDKGIDGRVIYQFRNSHPNFKLNKTSGVISVKESFKRRQDSRRKRETKEITLIVTASSGRPNSRNNMAVVQFIIDFSLAAEYAPGNNVITPLGSNTLSGEGAEEASSGGLAGWALGLVIALAVLAVLLTVIIVFLRMRHKRNSKKPVMGGNQDFDNSFDTLDIRPPPTSPASLGQYPPRYNDIPHYEPSESSHHVNGTTSEVSDQSHSASSGRGSAEEGEDVEDEEIRMINEGPLMQQQKLQHLGMPPDSGIQQDEDNLSDISVRNTQEYLARLGINTTHSDVSKVGSVTDLGNSTASVESIHMFDDDGGGDQDELDINNLIYAKVNDVNSDGTGSIVDGNRNYGYDEGQPSMTGSLSSIVHSEEELTGSYNWDYLLDWGPQYQPLAHVFAEIACLKDDNEPDQYKPMKKAPPKNVPPPLITNVAPRSIAPIAALTSPRTSHVMSMPALPRSPISHENSFTSSAMSPSFSPSLSPLATRTPSISPMVTSNAAGVPQPPSGNIPPSHHPSRQTRSNSNSELM